MANSSEYQRGYAAGRKARPPQLIITDSREDFIQQMMLAIMPHLLARPWETGGKAWRKGEDFAIGAREIAESCARRCHFSR